MQCRASPIHATRSISTTPRRFANEDTKPGSATAAAATPPAEQLKAVATEAENHKPSKEETTAAQLARLVSDLKALDPSVVSDAVRKGKRGIPFATDFELENDEHFDIEEDDKRKVASGFWAEGEESMGPDEDYFGDDLTSHGHGELAQHRQLREYNRLVAWEMPLLNRTYTLMILRTNGKVLTMNYRACSTLYTPNSRNPLPLPLHILPQRITPCRKQGGRRVLSLRSLPPGDRSV
jgi:small subunit ribosomal protein S35